ncbi:MAG: hypothetical protein KME42_19730 [Tildeniella nuda ZEHNDER 1965/U140]|jgi:hypothetical protein|nr:hypothetical protein [Tildeniella nuda ZEHNDER 1965/U140]
MKRLFIVLGLLSLTLTACGDGSGEGQMWSEITRNVGGAAGASKAASQAPATGAAKMLEDPDAETVNDSEEVWATTQEEAERRCAEIAAQRTNQGGTLVTVQGVSRVSSKRFFCQFRAETGGRN